MNPETTPAEEQRYAELQALALDFARAGNDAELAPMLAAGLPVNLTDLKGNSLLLLASYHGQLETTRLLLQHGAEPDRRNARGQTALGGVAFKGYDEIAELLLAHGADINADNGNGMTPIMFASMFGRTSTVALLQKHGAGMKHRNRLGLTASFMVRASALFGRWFRRTPREPK